MSPLERSGHFSTISTGCFYWTGRGVNATLVGCLRTNLPSVNLCRCNLVDHTDWKSIERDEKKIEFGELYGHSFVVMYYKDT